MSTSLRSLLVSLCLVVLMAPLSASAAQSAPVSRRYGPGGIAPALLPDRVLPADTAAQPPAPVLSASPANASAAQPVENWSRIVFESGRNGSWEILSMRPDGTDVRPLTSGPANDGRAQQSRADGRVAFVSDRSGNWDIYCVARDGSALRQLTADPAEDNDPAWSPDGKRIAFSSDRGGNWNVWVMNADGSAVAPFTSGREIDYGPAWSPDGQQIAWIRVTGPETGRIWVANVDGSNARSISRDQRFLEDLAWSPDGRTIAFSSDWGWTGFTSITGVSADGSDPDSRLVHSASSPMTDVLMGSYAPDGLSYVFAEVKYVERDGELYIDRAAIATKTSLATPNDPATVLPGSGLDLAPDWQKTDFVAPVSHFTVLPHLAAGNFGVGLSWEGQDSGGSGLLNYDLQHRIGDGPWVSTYDQPLTGTDFTVTFSPGQVVSFRVRARDAAGNVEPWPNAPEGDGTVTFYKNAFFGYVTDIRRTPVPGVQVQGPNYPAIPFLSGPDGSYEAYSFNETYTLKVAHPAYGELPESNVSANPLLQFDMVLPSKTNAVQNGGFENGLSGWTPSASDVAEVINTEKHSGQGALKLGKYSPTEPATYSISQAVVVPPADKHPTLSFFSRGYLGQVPNDRLAVVVIEAGQAPVDLTLNQRHIPLWSHSWADLAPWGGKTITLRFEVRLAGGEPTGSMVIDEVVVGEWRTPFITAATGPIGMTGEVTVLGENFEPGAVIRIDNTVLQTTFLDSTKLTATLAPGLQAGPRPLWVTNPGGEEALTALRLGYPLFLPLVSK